jgi:tyrosine-specific transport protein
VLTVVPPLAFAMAFPDVFYHALDFAGSYGVLTLFGLIPVAMCWSERYGGTSPSRQQLVPGGRPLLLAVAATAGGVIGRELLIATGQL